MSGRLHRRDMTAGDFELFEQKGGTWRLGAFSGWANQ